MTDPPADENTMDRWFGVTLNNRTWDALDAGSPSTDSTLDEREALLYGAYASAYHWRRVGRIAEQARGEHLLARTALRVGDFERALHHARRGHQLVTDHPDSVEDWDLAFALEALSRALAATGDIEAARARLDEAVDAVARVAETEDRAILEREMKQGEWFGLR
jgi:hypothetical protein